ncbi:serine hydroxymethyltransferase [Burkholderia lata]|uniref:serine hydroxymethyltransferase n=1 Tax=Burkholderia lata (strain ATCC 17760 / DSM 23089 / LMG 22485 / NCIMB 9086 / R18194 / 383) TaxID=482957 RepID=UPI0014541972|nr:serine hydroxymethyltransferase [Burkholderia lata]VWL87511.1 serine hydroxymethyltransferase [Burkholderia lata]
MFANTTKIADLDPSLWSLIEAERRRQEGHIELIASENYASPAVMQAQGTVLGNTYAEGYPDRRPCGGCEYVDLVERFAIERANALFGSAWANVQPHSGFQANAAVYMALLQPGDTILGMSPAHGGHLTHGAKVNFSGKLFRVVQYGVTGQGTIDYDTLERIARQCRPRMIVTGFSTYARHLDFERFRFIADQVGALLFVDIAHVAGLVAARLHPSPLPYADIVTSTTHQTLRGPRGGIILGRANADIQKKIAARVFPGIQGGPLMHVIAAKAIAFKEALAPSFRTYQQRVIDNARAMASAFGARGYDVVSGGTDNHLFVVDLTARQLTGMAAGGALGAANIMVSRHAVPNDPEAAFVTSGIRIGTPAATTRGFRESDAVAVAGWICDILDDIDNPRVIDAVRAMVVELCEEFPVYGPAGVVESPHAPLPA